MTEHEQVSGVFSAKNQSPINLDPSHTALIVVDMQRYFTEPYFPFTEVFEKLSPGMCSGYLSRVRETVIPNLQQLLSCFRIAGSPIVFTAVGSEDRNGNDLPCWLRSLDELGVAVIGNRVWPPVGDASYEIDPALRPLPNELVLNKLSAGTFATTNLAQRLRDQKVEAVVVTGVSTDVCVSTTAREAADRNFKMVAVSDACATLSDQQHQANLETLKIFGWVRTTKEVIDEMNK
jgi:nicotinamidase-related amidase